MDVLSTAGEGPAARTGTAAPGEHRRGSTPTAFVGRASEMSQGLAILDDVIAGHGRLLLVAGEAGIGKSRLADELASCAAERGIQVAWGRCWEAGGAPAYWPWVQSLRSVLRDADVDGLVATVGEGAADLAQLVPEMCGSVPRSRRAATSDPDAARFRLFDAVATVLRWRAETRPLMLVVDDLHVADTPSLLLLRFVAASLEGHRVLVMATYRDVELTATHPLTATLGDLVREPSARLVTLGGLDEADVAEVMRSAAGHAPPHGVARAVHDDTDGNPLFVQEVTRLLLEEGRLDDTGPSGVRRPLPGTVREVIGRRLAPLPDRSRHVLTLASILGREFGLDALARLAERSVEEVVECLEDPLAARVVIDVPGVRNRLRFAHVVIRECLYADIGRSQRMRLHRAAAQALADLYSDDLDPHLAELAHHCFEGASGDEAVDYAQRAAGNAVSLLAYEEAIRLYRLALQGLEMRTTRDAAERCELLLALGDAQGRAGDEAGWKQTFLEAAELARRLGLVEHLARAALGYGGRRVWVRAGDDPLVTRLLRDGLAAVGESDSVLRARMLARLAGALRDDHAEEPRESLAREAVEVARRLDDPGTLAYALEGLWAALWKPGNAPERLAIADELIAAGEAAADRERVVAGRQNRVLGFFELGDVAAARAELEHMDRVVAEVRQPSLSWLPADTRISLALLEGRFEEVEPLADLQLSLRGPSNRSDAAVHYALNMFLLRREQGRLDEVEDLLRETAAEFTWYPMLRCALAGLHCELGHRERARTVFESVAAAGFAAIPFDNHWLMCMSLLAEVVASLGDADRAATLYERLLPYADLTSLAAGGDGCRGSMFGALGLLAAAMGRFDDAERHLDEAVERNRRMGAAPALAHARYRLATILASYGRPGDRERAVALLDEALRTCDELGMHALRARVIAAGARLGSPAAEVVPAGTDTPAAGTPSPVGDGTVRLEGEYWAIGYGGRVLRVRDSKGMRVLARLLAEPGRPHAALDLERLDAPGDAATARALAAGDAGELIDERARRAYRARLAELREAVDDAEAEGAADRAGVLREEIDAIVAELSRALGIGGRPRRAGSAAERARLNVTRAVRSSLRRIATADAALGAHLEVTVHTGTVCVYSPDPRAAVGWSVSPAGR